MGQSMSTWLKFLIGVIADEWTVGADVQLQVPNSSVIKIDPIHIDSKKQKYAKVNRPRISMSKLRSKNNCAWNQAQTFSIPFLVCFVCSTFQPQMAPKKRPAAADNAAAKQRRSEQAQQSVGDTLYFSCWL